MAFVDLHVSDEVFLKAFHLFFMFLLLSDGSGLTSPIKTFRRLSFTLAQHDETAHVAGQIHQRNLYAGTFCRGN